MKGDNFIASNNKTKNSNRAYVGVEKTENLPLLLLLDRRFLHIQQFLQLLFACLVRLNLLMTQRHRTIYVRQEFEVASNNDVLAVTILPCQPAW